jgi:hypothetical protein
MLADIENLNEANAASVEPLIFITDEADVHHADPTETMITRQVA